MFVITNVIIVLLILGVICEQDTVSKKRQKRYLQFTKESQWGVNPTISIPIELNSYVSVAWFFQISYYNIDNATWFEPLLGDVDSHSRKSDRRSLGKTKDVVTRKAFYIFIETVLKRHGYAGRLCLLRAICENADAHFLHNGLIGDLLYFILTPSTSIAEDAIEDCFYEAEYNGIENNCVKYQKKCPSNPLELISFYIDKV